MTSTSCEDQVLKTDELGRVRTPKERREALLDEFEQSGLSGAKFAALVGVKYSTFASWAQRRRRRSKEELPAPKTPAPALPQLRWLEAVMDKADALQNPGGSALVVQLPGGARMEIADARTAALAAQLLRSLASFS